MSNMSGRTKLIQRMHEKGMTYESIGEVFGITKQRVEQILNDGPGDGFHKEAVNKIIYVGLRNWMLENRVGFTELSKRCGKTRIHSTLIGKHEPRKNTIDMILEVTGMTYEECFRKEPGETV